MLCVQVCRGLNKKASLQPSLCDQNAGTSDFLNSSLGGFAELFGFDDDWDGWESSSSKELEVSGLGDVNHGGLVFALSGLFSGFLAHEGPNAIQVQGWVENLVSLESELPDSAFSEVSWVAVPLKHSRKQSSLSQGSSTFHQTRAVRFEPFYNFEKTHFIDTGDLYRGFPKV
jgi:hypothetical protein